MSLSNEYYAVINTKRVETTEIKFTASLIMFYQYFHWLKDYYWTKNNQLLNIVKIFN